MPLRKCFSKEGVRPTHVPKQIWWRTSWDQISVFVIPRWASATGEFSRDCDDAPSQKTLVAYLSKRDPYTAADTQPKMSPKYSDAWIITPITPTKRSTQASTSKLPINHNKRDRGLLTPPCTPTRSSRQTASTASNPITFNDYQTLQRSPVGDGDGGVVVFEKGDIVIISSSAKTKGQQWLKTTRDIKQKTDSAAVVAKAKNRASHAVERVGIIKSFYEENRGEMRCRIHWLARPDLVWNGYDTKETWEHVSSEILPVDPEIKANSWNEMILRMNFISRLIRNTLKHNTLRLSGLVIDH